MSRVWGEKPPATAPNHVVRNRSGVAFLRGREGLVSSKIEALTPRWQRSRVRGCLRIVVPIIILIAMAIYCALPHPTHSRAQLQKIAAESRQLMATYPIRPPEQYADIPKDAWPPVIASLKPYAVTIYRGTVNITTRPYFDGGWGYGYAPEKQDLTMLVECWSELGHDVYWHGPC